MYYRIKALVVKEILAVWRDKKSRIALVAPPLMQLLILAHAATLEVKHITIGYVNQDSGWYSQELIQRLRGSPYFKNVHEYESEKETASALNSQQIILSLKFSPEFSEKIGADESGVIQLILDGRKTNASQIVNGYVNRIVEDFNREIIEKKGRIITTSPVGASLKQGQKNKTLHPTQKQFVEPLPFQGQIIPEFRSWFNSNLDYIYYNVPCLMAILSMVLSLAVTSLSVAREREMGTFDQLLVSPLYSWQILVGKTLPALIIAIGESSLIMVVGVILFKIPFRGSFFLLYFSMIFFILAILGVGLFISSLAKTQQQANLGSFVFMTPTMLLSGFATPVENMPEWLQHVSHCFPITHFFIIIKGVFLKDIGFTQVLQHIWPMMLISVFTLSIAGWMFGRRME